MRTGRAGAANVGSFDYAADGWGYTYGAAAEWYQGRWTPRGGIFDLSQTPTDGISPMGLNLDPTFNQFQLVGEIEERHELWGQPGKIKVTGFLSRGRAASFYDAVNLVQVTGIGANSALAAVRVYDNRPGALIEHLWYLHARAREARRSGGDFLFKLAALAS